MSEADVTNLAEQEDLFPSRDPLKRNSVQGKRVKLHVFCAVVRKYISVTSYCHLATQNNMEASSTTTHS